jgi:hypothetical protein
MHILFETVGRLKVETAQNYRNLAVFPLIGTASSAPDYVLLAEALAKRLARVTEVSEHGSVPELRFENRADQSVLLVDGEELIGARQNRVLNLTILVGVHQTVVIPVSCVERGRWRYRTRDFRSANRTLFAKARASKMHQVSESLRRTGLRRSDQQAVWAGIASKFERLSSVSSTEAMSELYDQQQARLANFRRSFAVRPAQVGAVFALNGMPVGAELFDSTTTFQRFLQKLLDSYAMDAVEEELSSTDVPSVEQAAAFLRRVQVADTQTFAAVGEGEDVRLHADGIAGGALVKDQRIVHLAAFAEAF